MDNKNYINRNKKILSELISFLEKNKVTYSEFEYLNNQIISNYNFQLKTEKEKLIFKSSDFLIKWNDIKK